MRRERVLVTGLGCISGLGQGAGPNWDRLLRGEGAIRTLARSYGDHPALGFEGPAAAVGELELSALQARLGARAVANLDPVSVFAAAAAFEALEHAGLLDHASLETRTAVLFGAGSGGNATFEEGFSRIYGKRAGSVHPLTIPKSMVSAPAAQLSMLFGIKGLTYTISSACSSSAHALGEAMHMIRAGRCDVALAGGGEAALTLGSWLGWSALRAMASDTCRPFSAGRKGLVLGEGAAMLVLESEGHARARGAEPLAELVAMGTSSDAHHLTETQALRAVYGEALATKRVVATKSAHGHLIGGGGALEFLLGVMALRRGAAPPVLNWLGLDPECDVPLVLEPEPLDVDWLLSSSFAFGGLNAVLVARRV